MSFHRNIKEMLKSREGGDKALVQRRDTKHAAREGTISPSRSLSFSLLLLVLLLSPSPAAHKVAGAPIWKGGAMR